MQASENGIAPPVTQPVLGRRLQPIIYSTLSMQGIGELVLENYEVTEPLGCTFVSRSVSDTYKITTSGQQFALKVYRAGWRPREDIEREMHALQYLKSRGVDVAPPVPNREGFLVTEVHAPEGLRSAVLFEWATGVVPKYNDPGHASRYGGALAKLHSVADGANLSALRAPMDMEYLFEGPLARIRSRLAEFPQIIPQLASLESRIRRRCDGAERHLRDWGFCHGDIWANNARLQGHRLVLFDFDFSGLGWQVFDLASYLWDARRRGAEEIAWKPFVDTYLQVRPGLAQSLEYIGLFVILKHLWTTAFFIERAPETGTNFLADEDLEMVVPYCERIEAELG